MRIKSLFGLFLIAGCTTSHTPREYAPYFRLTPPNYLSSDHVYERTRLEQAAAPTVWDRKRLMDLYELEMQTLEPGNPRILALAQALEKQPAESKELAQRLAAARLAPGAESASDAKPTVFVTPQFKSAYLEAQRLWNRDDNALALERIRAIEADTALLDSLEHEEKKKLWYLTFRVALDNQDLKKAQEAWGRMRDDEACGQSAADAGFLLSMHWLAAGDGAQAHKIFLEQCDPDESPTNRQRRAYWQARFAEATGGNGQAGYDAIVQAGVPSYYLLLAAAKKNQKVSFGAPAYSYRQRLREAASGVVENWRLAEENLDRGLRPDAAVYLQRASQKLMSGPGPKEVDALLYTAHLLQAAGVQLEAMRIYSKVIEIALASEEKPAFDFLPEMFPQGHLGHVVPKAKHWGVDPDFAYAIIRQESAFNPAAVSSAGAQGLMQLMPFLGKEIAGAWGDSRYTQRSLFFARENIKYGTYHLGRLQREFPHPALVAAAYNAGSKRAAAWWKRFPKAPLDVFVELIPITETRNYVKLVLRNQMFYKAVRSDGILPFLPGGLEMPQLSNATL